MKVLPLGIRALSFLSGNRVSAVLAFLFAAAAPVFAAGPVPRVAEPIELFAAIEQGIAEVGVFPLDSKVVHLQIRNLSDTPLTLRMPAALAASPVLAQQPFPGGNNGNGFNNGFNNANQGGGNQSIGLSGPNNNNNNRGQPNPGFFNVPAEKVIKVRLACVCLEHGKRDPNPRVKYELRALEDVNADSRLVGILTALGRGEVSQPVAQLAAWHVANEKSWAELASLKIEHIQGFSSPLFTSREIAVAKNLVDGLTTPVNPDAKLSRR